MSLVTNITNLTTRIATETKSIRTLLNGNAADLTTLTTTDKTNLVAALNEIKGLADTVASGLSTAESDITALEGSVGTLSGLTTTDKTNLVAAINELVTALANIDVSAQIQATISDTTTSTTTLWSSSKTSSEISSAVSALVDAAPGTLDTLNELAAALGDDANFSTTITTALAGKSDLGHTHAISDVTGLQAALDSKANSADVGDTTTDFVPTFEAGLV